MKMKKKKFTASVSIRKVNLKECICSLGYWIHDLCNH
uniref:Uncharacterized protein n=1 Tax=Anguilla anguilla TaxID=7936 RepID=A0A0E9WYJ7_ANGAN